MSNALKPGWKMVKFGDVVRNANLVERDPQNAGIERVVGLEHIDPENLHIKRWASTEDGTSFNRKFVPGQTLFGKRRAYQRKVAFAEFTGICSGDILTFESKDPKVLLPELLPFICQTDSFFDYALGTSAGSLSPRTSWSALKEFEFPLPPLEEQKRMAEILWVADEAVSLHELVYKQTYSALTAHLDYFFPKKRRSLIKEQGEECLSNLCKESISYGIVQAGEHIPEGIPYIRVSDMTSGELTLNGMLRTSPAIAAKFKRSTVQKGDIVVALRGDVGLVRVVPSNLHGANLTQGTARISPKPGVNRDYLLWALRSQRSHRQYNIFAKGSTFKEITLADLRNVLILCNCKSQESIALKLNALHDVLEYSKRNCLEISKVRSALLNFFMHADQEYPTHV